jgi:hypothetical protein
VLGFVPSPLAAADFEVLIAAAIRKCQGCHDLSVVIEASGQSREEWNATIEEMVISNERHSRRTSNDSRLPFELSRAVRPTPRPMTGDGHAVRSAEGYSSTSVVMTCERSTASGSLARIGLIASCCSSMWPP